MADSTEPLWALVEEGLRAIEYSSSGECDGRRDERGRFCGKANKGEGQWVLKMKLARETEYPKLQAYCKIQLINLDKKKVWKSIYALTGNWYSARLAPEEQNIGGETSSYTHSSKSDTR